MTEQDAARILLVRSIEETDPSVFPPSRLTEALAASANDLRPSFWFLARARYLLDAVPHTYGSIIRMAHLPQGWNTAICLLAFLIGLATNYLGSFEKIPLVLNPIMTLVGWNLLLYTVFIVSFLFCGFEKSTPAGRARLARKAPLRARRRKALCLPHQSGRAVERACFIAFDLDLYSYLHTALSCHTAASGVLREGCQEVLELLGGSRAAANDGAVAPLVALRCAVFDCGSDRRNVHTGRLFTLRSHLDQHVYYRGADHCKTGGRDLRSGHLGLAHRRRDLGGDIDIAQLMSPAGAPAASWIHLFVLTAFLVIMVPRSILAVVQGLHIRRAKNNIRIDFDDYFAGLIRPQVETLIAQEIDRGVQAFTQTMANFVCEGFYDKRIVPELAQFRATGGRISDLRERIKARCEDSRDEISAFAGIAVKELESSIGLRVGGILRSVQQDFRLAATMGEDLIDNLEILPEHEFDLSVKPIGEGFTDALGATISASVAVALGTLAGGFGESLEIAVLVALFGTTGPVGFLIGAIVGLIVGAGAWWFGRDKITEHIENISLPRTLLGMVLWQSRFDNLIQQGRVKCHELVKNRVADLLSPLAVRVGGEVWMGLEELWRKDRHRAAPTS